MRLKNNLILFAIRQQNIIGLIARKLNLQNHLNITLLPPTTIATVNNCKFNVNLSDHLGYQLYVFNMYERTTFHHLLRLLKPNDIAIDIGANIGLYSVIMGSRLKNGIVHSFEPVSDNYANLQKNIALNNSTNVLSYKKGISSESSFRNIFVYEHNMMASNLYNNKTGKSETIELTTLDKFCVEQNMDRVNIIKVDIEGGETNFLIGAEQTIRKQKDLVLVIEYNPKIIEQSGFNPIEMYNQLKSFGFNLYLPRELSWKKPMLVTHFDQIKYLESNLICIKGNRSYD